MYILFFIEKIKIRLQKKNILDFGFRIKRQIVEGQLFVPNSK